MISLEFTSKVDGTKFYTLDGEILVATRIYSKMIQDVSELSKPEIEFIIRKYSDQNRLIREFRSFINNVDL